MMKILLDTDVLIEHLRGNEKVTSRIGELFSTHVPLAYSPVTEAEIFRGLRSNERDKTQRMLSELICLEIGTKVGQRAGEYLKKYTKSHGLEIADALVAATAAIHKFALCTFNWKHYPMSEVERFYLVR